MPLTISQTEPMIQAAKAKALELGANVSIAVVDGRGDLLVMLRLDNARWYTADVCRGKAFASATWGRPSEDLQERADHPVFRSVSMMQGGRIIPAKGALPISQDGQVVGAIGVSGGAPEQDVEIAQAGLDTLS
jgi:uncharacterized protein GlcG (DUF336 family)